MILQYLTNLMECKVCVGNNFAPMLLANFLLKTQPQSVVVQDNHSYEGNTAKAKLWPGVNAHKSD